MRGPTARCARRHRDQRINVGAQDPGARGSSQAQVGGLPAVSLNRLEPSTTGCRGAALPGSVTTMIPAAERALIAAASESAEYPAVRRAASLSADRF